jgi:TolB-like protein/Tfp pilus assembly protein PilF
VADLLERLQRTLSSAYRIERELGGGGMSRVFVAEEVALGRRVVLKVLPPDLAAGLSIERFRREIHLAASLHHPHIVPLLAAGEADGLLYYTMPLIEGESLRTKLAREAELPVGEVVRLLRDVVDALSCAHQHGVAHRDIKPDNVLVTSHHAVVTDFGVAKALTEASGRSSLTSAGVALGTPAYMAPEQATADPHADHRVDLYAVGALAYEMLTGRPPFIGPTPQAVLAAHVTQAPEALTRFRPNLPPGLAALVMRCLEKRPADRWQSTDELLHQLEAMATPSGGLTPTASRLPAVPPPALSVRRPAARAGYLVLGLLLALAVSWGIMRYRDRPGVSTATERTLAVLPFENLGRPDEEYFADGITEEITNRLTGIGGLKVIARSSARQYKGSAKPIRQIGEELGAGYILEGTIRWERAGDSTNRVRVSPQLIRVADGTNVWAHGYDAIIAGVFQVQSDIAQQVAEALDVALAGAERQALAQRPTENSEAYDNYLRGNNYNQRGTSELNLKLAEQMYQRAVELDPSFALAWAALARTHDNLYWFYIDRSDARLTRVKEAVDRALRLQPELPEAHVAAGYYHYHGHLDYESALREFNIAAKSRPNDSDILSSIGFVERRLGKWDDARANITKAATLDPRSVETSEEAGLTLMWVRSYPEAEPFLRRPTTLAPDQPTGYGWLAEFYLVWKGDRAATASVIRQGLSAVSPGRLVPELVRWGKTGVLLTAIGEDPGLARLLEQPLENFSDTAGYYEWKTHLAGRSGHLGKQRAYADSASRILEDKVKQRPDEHIFRDRLGIMYALLGRKADAVREGKYAVALRPLSKDALDGATVLQLLAWIYALVGEHELAVEQLKVLLSVPSGVSVARLRSDWTWAPLRGHAGFERLVEKGR